MKDVYIDVDAKSSGTFLLADTDITEYVRSVQVIIEPGLSTKVMFELNANCLLAIKEGVIRVLQQPFGAEESWQEKS